MKYNKKMSLALILILIGAVSCLIGTLTIRTALGQILWLIGMGLVLVAIILVLFVKIATKKQDNDEKNKW